MKILLFPLLCFIAMAISSAGQAPHPTFARADDAPVPITLGQSVVALTGPWKFHIGDNPQWADPFFDDSGWQSFALMPPHSPLTPEEITQSAALPGWQQHGHPGYTGYAWYRLRLQLPEDVDSPALLMPQLVDDAYEVYLNGAKIGAFGDLNGWPLSYIGQPQLFSIPTAMPRSNQPVTLALRFSNQRKEAAPSERNQAGGLRGVPLVGTSSLLQIFEQSIEEHVEQRTISPGETAGNPWELIGLAVLYIAVGLISWFLFLFSRRHREYLWAGISLMGFGAMLALIAISVMPQTAIPAQVIFVAQIVMFPAASFAMPLAAMYLLEVPRVRWRRANYVVAPVNLMWSLQLQGLHLGLLPPTAATDFVRSVTLWLGELSLGCLLLAIAIDGVRTIGRRAWLPMTPGLLFALYCLTYDLAVSGIFNSFVLGRLICASVPIVGGDFFQILPSSDGSLLIVVGDVSGKGLKAAMTVSAIIGALRDLEERQPAHVLAHLNRVLCGQIAGFATCCAVLITDDGSATIANAGHLAPYCNGDEIPIESSLPLGIALDAAYIQSTINLSSGDHLTFLSDGVVEAQSSTGELFGFDRTQAISTQSAKQIADAAQRWGQEDDITVLSVTLTAKLQEATA